MFANLPEHLVILYLFLLISYSSCQKRVSVRTGFFFVKRSGELRSTGLSCRGFLAKIVDRFDFALENLIPRLHTLSTVALEATLAELS